MAAKKPKAKKQELEDLVGLAMNPKNRLEMALKQVDKKIERGYNFRRLFVTLLYIRDVEGKRKFQTRDISHHKTLVMGCGLFGEYASVYLLLNTLEALGFLVKVGPSNTKNKQWMFQHDEELFTKERVNRVKELLKGE